MLVGVAFADPVADAAAEVLEVFRTKGGLKGLAAKDDPATVVQLRAREPRSRSPRFR